MKNIFGTKKEVNKKSKTTKQYNKKSFTGFSDEMFSGSIMESYHGIRFNIDSHSHAILSH